MIKFWAFHLLSLGLNALDLYTTSMVSPSREINPLAAGLWRRNGFGALILLKGCGWGLVLLCHLVIMKRWPRYLKAAWKGVYGGLIILAVVVACNCGIVF